MSCADSKCHTTLQYSSRLQNHILKAQIPAWFAMKIHQPHLFFGGAAAGISRDPKGSIGIPSGCGSKELTPKSWQKLNVNYPNIPTDTWEYKVILGISVGMFG